MAIAALITWLVTAVGGFLMLSIWVAHGGARADAPGTSHLPPALVFGHLGVAVVGLVLWISYVLTDNHAVAWIAFALLLVVAALGFVMLARWWNTPAASGTASGNGEESGAGRAAESHFPVAIIAGHGVFAAATLLFSFLAALGL
ncbi:hypothetical protein FHX37_3544 [Haloactinospora alba]|uniref:DUF2269 family protein n=1 Tax=Haloactinospora alba TaxID=405555 RepID=A0A543NNX4_9ACTN|nr:hypothetical protein [Haloactinospora alba]TQN33522.1 hypothetical protein FHX37_3544 [Haloactinospora alba]